MSVKAKKELLDALRPTYASASVENKTRFIDSLVAATGYNRKYATGLLARIEPKEQKPRGRKSTYGPEFCETLLQLWLAADKVCSKRLVPFIPELLESLQRCGRLTVLPEQKAKLAQVSPATVDRLLKDAREKYGRRRRTPKSLSRLKLSVAVRTCSDELPNEPGFLEADLVHHSGSDPSGKFACTLTAVDFASGWLELVAIPDRTDQSALHGFVEIQNALPFPLRGLDTDNGSEFINHALNSFCLSRQIQFTRSRGYKKNDQAHVEQKNGAVVRKLTGYQRFESTAVQAINELYRSARLYINFYQPSLKLAAKKREGSKILKQYESAATPFQRLMKSGRLEESVRARLERTYAMLDPVLLLERVQQAQRKLRSLELSSPSSFEPKASIPHRKKRGRPVGSRAARLDHYAKELDELLCTYPNCGAAVIRQMLQARHPDSKIPACGTFRRFIRDWRAAHPELSSQFPKLARPKTILIG